MSVQESIIKEIENLKELITSSELIESENTKELETIESDIKNFKVYLPLIGSFNAGKSSILNTLLGNEELLPTDIIPETAIATEIIYDTHERVEACSFENDETIETFSNLNDIKGIDIDKYGYLRVFKNLDFLAQNKDIILVDMPGLDSNIDRHNSQILNYIQKDGISFVAIVDIDDGGLKDSTLNFIEEINSYNLYFFTIINKIDKKPSSEVTKIRDNIRHQLLKYSENPYVGVVTTFDDDIEEFKNILLKINRDRYIKSIFIPKTISNIDKITQDLSIRRDNMVLDTSEIDNKIDELNESIYQFDKSLRREEQRIENKFSTNTATQILDEVQQALRQNIDRLIISIETSQDNFKITINDIIRPVIVNSISKYTQQEFSVSIENLEASSRDMFADISDFIDKSQTALDIVSTTIKTTPLLLKIPTLMYILDIIKKKVNPILYIILTIVSVASTFFGKSKEEQKRQNQDIMRDKILNAIPSIAVELQPNIVNTLNNIKDEFFTEIVNSINEQKDALTTSLNRAKEEKKIYKSDFKGQIDSFNTLIGRINDFKQRLLKVS